MTEWFWESFLASVGATISGFILLLTHHWKVKQEINIHRGIENFNRRQNAYREILQLISKMTDHSHFLGKPVNWRIIRHAYDEIMVVGSKDVVKLANEIIVKSDKLEGKKLHGAIKQLWNVIRSDLYGESLPLEEMHIITPSPDTISALNTYHKYANELKAFGINNIEDASEMDVIKIKDKIEIKEGALSEIKEMAKKELSFEEEFRKFVEGKLDYSSYDNK